MKEYFDRIRKYATELDRPMAYRRGGGVSIGIILDQEEENQEHAWVACGIPHTWGPVTFRQWLKTQKWTILDCRAPNSKSQQWSFHGLLKGQTGRSSCCSFYVETCSRPYCQLRLCVLANGTWNDRDLEPFETKIKSQIATHWVEKKTALRCFVADVWKAE